MWNEQQPHALCGFGPGRGAALMACALWVSACSGDDGSGGMASGISTGTEQDGGRLEDPPRVLAPAGDDAPDHEVLSGEQAYLCGYDDEDAHIFPGGVAGGEVAVANDGRGFALVHGDERGALFIEAIPIGQPAQQSVRLLNPEGAPGAVALAAVESSFLMLWRSGDRLLARNLAADPQSEPRTLEDSLADAVAGGQLFALVAHPDHFVSAWVDGAGGLRALRLDAGGAPVGQPAGLATDAAPLDLELGRLDGGRTLVAWRELDSGGDGRVMGQVLAADLTADGEPVQVNDNPVADARFAVGARRASAGVLFHAREGGVRDTVKYRRIDPEGQPSQPVLNLVNAPGLARDGSIAAFGQGYAVAYRALPSLGVDRPTLRIAFVNQFGRIVHEADLGETSEAGGRTAITATAGAELLVGWTTDWPSGPRTHAIQLDCPGALVLCGGSVE